MEDVIVGLLFVYFFVIRPILKQVRRGDAKTQGTKPRAPLSLLLEKLREKLREAAEQVETGKRGQAGRRPANTWKELFADAPEPENEPWATASSPQHQEGWPVADPWIPEADVGRWDTPAEQPEPVRPAPERAPAAATAEPVQAASAPRPARFGVDLRQAVVWSEVLGPPVSLRDGG